MGYLVHYEMDESAKGKGFDARIQAMYQAALNEGLWTVCTLQPIIRNTRLKRSKLTLRVHCHTRPQ